MLDAVFVVVVVGLAVLGLVVANSIPPFRGDPGCGGDGGDDATD